MVAVGDAAKVTPVARYSVPLTSDDVKAAAAEESEEDEAAVLLG